MQKIVVFGKGGIGKSTIAASLSAVYALGGKKVIHVGCDPKHDSTVSLVDGALIETFMEKHARIFGIRDHQALGAKDLLVKGRLGIDCIEAGGPEPGVGCAGRGISMMLEAFQELDVLESGAYDVGVFDVLGDVVCGGFAAPLRKGFAEKIVIVVSEELMALYAANNIAKSVRTYASNGVYLAGLVANLKVKDGKSDRKRIEKFAKAIGTSILEYIPRDPAVREAEFARDKTVVERSPKCPFAKSVRSLAAKILAARKADCPIPTPMNDKQFYGGW
ncbi:MAG: AAA family ATPase [Elusimicrobia bacterium]|nr:AAA family ATPase [Elusimicrobiota bacterium]